MAKQKRAQKIIKRLFDIFTAILLLIVLFPLLCIIGILVYYKMGRPVFFTQIRPGKDGMPFKIYKFRTMLNLKPCHDQYTSDEIRLTPFGHFLRRTSLDELPELFNVVKGEMSLVGPRPLLMEYLKEYNEQQARRHEVKPGITGWTQVNGRNSISWEEKFKLDVWYVDHWNLLLDFKILLLTIVKVLKQEGISQTGMATVERFKGSG